MNKKTVRKKVAPEPEDNTLLSKAHNIVDGRELMVVYATNPGFREKLCRTMIHWAKQPGSLDLMQFCMEYGIKRPSLYQWAREHPEVKEAFDEMNLMIACHRKVGVMNKKLDGTYSYKEMHKLDPEYIEINKYHAELAQRSADIPTTINVYAGKPPVQTKEDLKKEVENV